MNDLLKEIIHFYKQHNLDLNSSYELLKNKAKEIIKIKNLSMIPEHLSDWEFLEQEIGITSNKEEDYDMIISLSNFIIAIKNVIDGYEPKFSGFIGLQRQFSPPIEVFEKIGFNELNIKQSKISYALLF